MPAELEHFQNGLASLLNIHDSKKCTLKLDALLKCANFEQKTSTLAAKRPLPFGPALVHGTDFLMSYVNEI